MKLPVSQRLLCCAALVCPGSIVADVGTDHGYLAIHLLQAGICPHVIAADLREQPLAKARQNAARFGTAEKMEFVLSDGLHNIKPGSFDTLVCAGMGGDCIALVLDAAPWLKSSGCTLILQPQTSGNDLRRYLGTHGYTIAEERLVRDGRFLYTAMRVCAGEQPLTPGQQYISPALLASRSPLLPEYRQRLVRSLTQTVAGIAKGETDDDRRKLEYYTAALREICEMGEYDGNL